VPERLQGQMPTDAQPAPDARGEQTEGAIPHGVAYPEAGGVPPFSSDADTRSILPSAPRDESAQFNFAKLLKRMVVSAAAGSNAPAQYKWLVEGTDGTTCVVERCVAVKFP